MRKTAGAIVLLSILPILSGCVTGMSGQEIREQAATKYSGSTSVNESLACLRGRLGNEANVTTYPDGGLAEIAIGRTSALGEFGYAYLVTLKKDGGGTLATVRSAGIWFPHVPQDKLDSTVRACVRS